MRDNATDYLEILIGLRHEVLGYLEQLVRHIRYDAVLQFSARRSSMECIRST